MPHWKKDSCQKQIALQLALAGCAVMDLSKIGKGVPDLLCIRGNTIRLFELKSKYGKFTPAQIKWQRDNPRLMQDYRTIKTIEEGLKEMSLL
jgi:hypothetical protein